MVASGSTIEAYIDGEKQIDYTDDAPILSGTRVAFSGYAAQNSEIRLFRMYSGSTYTVTGLNNAEAVTLRGAGDLPYQTAAADVSGVATFTPGHYPLVSIERDGTIYEVDGGIWGGDTYAFE